MSIFGGTGMWSLIGGGLLGGGANLLGTIIQGNQQKEIAEATNAANLANARENRDWQERMSSTAHQREVADLEKAGLNPVLSAMGGPGSSTPSGSTAVAQQAQVPDYGAAAGRSVSSAMEAIRLGQELKASEALINKTEAEAGLTKAQEGQVAFATVESARRADLLDKQSASEAAKAVKLRAEGKTAGVTASNARQSQQLDLETKQANLQIAKITAGNAKAAQWAQIFRDAGLGAGQIAGILMKMFPGGAISNQLPPGITR